jgi:H+/Cl- antiporter ClcA
MSTPEVTVTARRLIPAMALAGIVGLVLGYAVLEIVNAGIALVWETIPSGWTTTPAWYVVGVLVLAAVLVYVVRTYIGDTGHSPLQGIAVSGLTPQEYLGAILAILASLFGGVVLGPEVALVATGSVVGTLVAKLMGITDAESAKKVIGIGALGAILALFVGPLLAGSLSLDDPKQSIEVDQLAWAVLVAIIATVAITLARVGAAFIAKLTGGRPHLRILVGSALVIAIAAIAMQYVTGESVLYVVTSGEELITELPTLTSASTVIAIIIFKTIAYAVSLGAGFRGGPFFPAMFIGAASGLFIALVLPSGPSVQAALVVGVVASVIATAKMKWPLAIALGIVIGFVMGTWTLVPAAVIGAVVARAIPRWGDRLSAAEDQHLR